jgi:hypothetical protein
MKNARKEHRERWLRIIADQAKWLTSDQRAIEAAERAEANAKMWHDWANTDLVNEESS